MSKEAFKEFVKKNSVLVKYVKNNNMSWQKFYELYDMYGEDNKIWDEYLMAKSRETIVPERGDFMNYFKNINLDSIQESITSLQRVIGVIGDLAIKNDNPASSIIEKPIYKHMDD